MELIKSVTVRDVIPLTSCARFTIGLFGWPVIVMFVPAWTVDTYVSPRPAVVETSERVET
jgi:hypothetical protein